MRALNPGSCQGIFVAPDHGEHGRVAAMSHADPRVFGIFAQARQDLTAFLEDLDRGNMLAAADPEN